MLKDFPGCTVVKNLPANSGFMRDEGLISGLEKSPVVRNGDTLHYCCLENFMDRESCWATVLGAAKSQTQLSD